MLRKLKVGLKDVSWGLGSILALVVTLTAQVSPAQASVVRCGQVVRRNTTLTAYVGPCPGMGIIIGGPRPGIFSVQAVTTAQLAVEGSGPATPSRGRAR